MMTVIPILLIDVFSTIYAIIFTLYNCSTLTAENTQESTD